MKDDAGLIWLLGNEVRLRILNLLLHQPGGTCTCEFVDALRLPQPRVSRQLRILRSAGLVTRCQRGTWAHYDLPPNLQPLAKEMVKTIATDLLSEGAREDGERLRKRLRLRVKGRCAVGYELGQPFHEVIPRARKPLAKLRRPLITL